MWFCQRKSDVWLWTRFLRMSGVWLWTCLLMSALTLLWSVLTRLWMMSCVQTYFPLLSVCVRRFP